MMRPTFEAHIEKLPALFTALQGSQPFLEKGVAWQKGKSGIYVLLEAETAVYVGRTRNLQGRLMSHKTPRQNKAAFAFKRTRILLDRKATYKSQGSRKDLMKDPVFHTTFLEQIEAIKAMYVQFLEVENPIDQYLLELYAHLELNLPLSEFDTH